MFKFVQVVLVASGLIYNSAFADLVVSIGNSNSSNRTAPVVVEAGGSVTLGLYIHNDRAADLPAEVLGLAFDISLPGSANLYDGHNGAQLMSFLSNFRLDPVVPVRSGLTGITDPGNVVSSPVTANGFDVFVDFTASAPIQFAGNGSQSTAIHLANISFNTSAATQLGTYGFKFNPAAQFPGDQGANSASNSLGLAVGQDGTSFNRFTVTAVPEPSSLLLGGLALGWISWRNRRKHLCGKKDRVMAM